MKRILFVDDEVDILSGLKRMLRDRRHDWDMVFVESGRAALQALEESPFDVIVSDMQMPGMDGAALLAKVQESFPRTVRIVLSGHSELQAVLRSVPVAHQFLAKPCPVETIREVVDRACELQRLVTSETLRASLSGIDSLPARPRVYHELTQALVDPDVAVDLVVNIVTEDQAICAEILKLVNSSFFGLRSHVASVGQAVTFLGIKMLKDIVLSIEVMKEFKVGGVHGLSSEQEHRHASLVAKATQQMLEDPEEREDAFTAALLHDVGRMILHAKMPEDFEGIVSSAIENNTPLHEAEVESLGVSHAEIGAYLLGIWGLPYAVVEAVAHHHEPRRVETTQFGILGAVHVADALVREQTAIETQSSFAYLPLDLEYCEQVGVLEKVDEWRSCVAELFQHEESVT